MDILPIKSIREEDGSLVGANMIQLAKLSQLGFPVPQGYAIIPPEIKLKTVIEHYDFKNREVFEQTLTLIKKEVNTIPPPEEMSDLAKKAGVATQDLWRQLMDVWLDEIKSKLWREGFSPSLTRNLSSQPVLFTDRIMGAGTAYFDQIEEKVVIEQTRGLLEHQKIEELAELVMKMNQKLLIPQVYHWIAEADQKLTKLSIVKVNPYTQSRSFTQQPVTQVQEPVKIDQPVSSIKLFVNSRDKLHLVPQSDGILIEYDEERPFDAQVFQLIESGFSLPHGQILFKLSNKNSQLLHTPNYLKPQVEIFLFARNKKQLLNVSLIIPSLSSRSQLTEVKQLLSAKGISRRGSLKFWLELASPENVINIDGYLDAGIDGVVINTDQLLEHLLGQSKQPDQYFDPQALKTLNSFLEPALKILHKNSIPVILAGDLALKDELLEFALTKGVWGICSSIEHAPFTREQLHFLEKRLLRKRLG